MLMVLHGLEIVKIIYTGNIEITTVTKPEFINQKFPIFPIPFSAEDTAEMLVSHKLEYSIKPLFEILLYFQLKYDHSKFSDGKINFSNPNVLFKNPQFSLKLREIINKNS